MPRALAERRTGALADPVHRLATRVLDALEDLRARRAGLLVAAKRDRVARDVVVAATIERLVAKACARLVTADGVSAEDTPEGALQRTLMDAFAAFERAQIAARTRAALAAKRRKGERAGQVPYGYSVAADGSTLRELAAEQRVIRRVHALRERGLGIVAIAEKLNACGVPARGARWHRTTVHRILVRADALG